MNLAERYGFEVRNYDNYVGTADLDKTLPRSLDMLAHTDVVPAGEGWTVTEPFSPIVKDGRIYGRGTSDDKGPLLCAMYAMRAIRENGVKLRKGFVSSWAQMKRRVPRISRNIMSRSRRRR